MNKNMLVVLGVAVLAVAGCTEQKGPAVSQQPAAVDSLADQAKAAAAQAEAEAKTAAEAAAKAQAEAEAQAQAAAQQAQAATEAALSQVTSLLTESRQLLSEGKLQEALTKAQGVLSIDASNVDAQSLIETIKAKIAESAGEAVGGIKADVTNAIGNLGN